ncbi:MAG TPA: SLC13 family permease [Tepidiformaceae bacterium]|nr:SLC13 family permease [Tepidiformaceae bacterium]
MREAVVAVIFLATIAALYFRPPGAKDWQVALAGAILAWLASPLTPAAALRELRGTWNIEAFFLGLMLLAAGAETAGLYARAAQWLGRFTGPGARVAAVLGSGTAITAILSNDATPLILTPAVFAAAATESASTTAAAFAVTFAADGASLLLPISNPVGLLFYDRFGLTFGDWMRDIFPAAVAAIVVLAAVLWWRSRSVGSGQDARLTSFATPSVGLERWAAGIFGALAVVYIAAAAAGIALGLVTLAGGIALMAAVVLSGSGVTVYCRKVSPGLLIFVAALLVLVRCASAAGVFDSAGSAFDWLAGEPIAVALLGAAIAGMALSNLVNNWPAAVVLATLISGQGAGREPLLVGALIGCTVGANLTVVGSLSTVFWLSLTRQAGARYTTVDYGRRAWRPTLAAVAAAWLVAWACLVL